MGPAVLLGQMKHVLGLHTRTPIHPTVYQYKLPILSVLQWYILLLQ